MEKNNIKLKNIRKCLLCPPLLPVKSPKISPERNIFFLTKFKMASKHNVEVIHELFDIYFDTSFQHDF